MSSPRALSGTVQRVHHELWNEEAGAQRENSPHGEPALELDMERRIRSLIADAEPLATAASIEHVVDQVKARIDGLGPLHQHGLDETVTEIMVNGDGSVWVEREGRLERTGQHLDPETTLQLARRLASNAGRRIDRTEPSVDVRLKDGSRLHAIIPPLAVDGPCLTIRRFAVRSIDLAELAAPSAKNLLMKAVTDHQTIVIGGGTSSGKTTLLNALAAFIDADSRVVTIEDAAELRLPGNHVVRLETRNATEGVRHVGVRELVRHALRMRPDRIICGEMRGAEALDLVQALNTGHRGSLSTVHANSASGVLRRIETMMLLGDADLPLQAIREQLADCIDLVVMTSRGEAGARRVVQIARVPERPTADWSLEAIFEREDSHDEHVVEAPRSGGVR
jgi:pilus assembly protein CpaF